MICKKSPVENIAGGPSLRRCQDPADYSKVSCLSSLGDIFIGLKLMEQKKMESEMDKE